MVVARVNAELEGAPDVQTALGVMLSGGSVTDAARESGLSRQAIYRALARIRAWVEGGMSDLDALRAAFERGRITDGSRLAGQYEADPAALRALARIALAELPAGPADGEDEAAWAILDEADPLGAPDLVVPDAPVVVPAAFAGVEVVAPMAPLVIKPKRGNGWLWGVLATAGVAIGAFATWRIMDAAPDGPAAPWPPGPPRPPRAWRPPRPPPPPRPPRPPRRPPRRPPTRSP
ncbi:MAG: helix-turn-helix domain-containing protein [bacterium]